MTEYIIRVDEDDKRWHYVERQYTHFFGYPITEEIVRCRDCKHYDGEPDLCSSEPKCWRDPDHQGTHIWTRPDGYCAWGERKEGE